MQEEDDLLPEYDLSKLVPVPPEKSHFRKRLKEFSIAEDRFKHIKPRQLVFPERTECTHVYPDGREERVIYGQYEGVNVVLENGWPVDRNTGGPLSGPRYCIEEMVRYDGTKIVFDNPLYLLYEEEYGDGSGRKAKGTRQ